MQENCKLCFYGRCCAKEVIYILAQNFAETYTQALFNMNATRQDFAIKTEFK